MHAVAETSIFSRRADALLERRDRAELISTLASDPTAGSLIPGLGGVRKMRFAPVGRGKSGAFRVVYYLASANQPILALLIYGKNEQQNITPKQRDAIVALITNYKAQRHASYPRRMEYEG